MRSITTRPSHSTCSALRLWTPLSSLTHAASEASHPSHPRCPPPPGSIHPKRKSHHTHSTPLHLKLMKPGVSKCLTRSDCGNLLTEAGNRLSNACTVGRIGFATTKL